MDLLNPRIEGEFVIPAPQLPPRPFYFEPEEPKMCPACRAGGICGCILFLPQIT